MASGVRHRLASPGEAVAVIVEIKRGGDCNEDDIVRFHDDYGRSAAQR